MNVIWNVVAFGGRLFHLYVASWCCGCGGDSLNETSKEDAEKNEVSVEMEITRWIRVCMGEQKC